MSEFAPIFQEALLTAPHLDRYPSSSRSLLATMPTPAMLEANVPVLTQFPHPVPSMPCAVGVGNINRELNVAEMSLPFFVAQHTVAHWTNFRPFCKNKWYVAMNLGEAFDVVVSEMSRSVFCTTLSQSMCTAPVLAAACCRPAPLFKIGGSRGASAYGPRKRKAQTL